VTRDFTVAVFVVSHQRVLMHRHSKLAMWLPPGGHIEPGELPDDAAVREVMEETGVAITLIGQRALPVEYPRQLLTPQGIQLEDISPDHQHIDLVYYGTPATPLQCINPELAGRDQVGWYSALDLSEMDLTYEIRLWCARALEFFG